MNRANFSIAEYRDYVAATRKVEPGELARCSPGEVANLMRVQQVSTIPGLYREFLLTMGKNPRPLLPWVDWTYKDLVQIKGDMIAELRDLNKDVSFLDDALMIALDAGYFIFYIPQVSTAGDDPPVWTCEDGTNQERTYHSFRDFLFSIAMDDRRSMGG